ncbi:DUF1183-domain-containing protein [Melanomma pulvis-pyrius CBS 109.77]|uniref:Store-operated calcium entry-associated regulatory factor n=1 Tax=Melanomma pulvis-pyrius CBS 109.77 TaxID=1314802 RepID=A0A6A6X3U8_9PLEO|nr:DUF1183-domain-containing protein [Melanomma pulvis-pyrius CBS 109.77]
MHCLNFLYPALLTTTTLFDGALALRSGNKIKLSNVQSLTLRSGLKTSHRRVPAMPQLSCVGGSARGLYEVDVMRCKNAGYDYNEEDIQWTCTATLPEEFKLGSTEVICEGYDSPDDPYVLKGSCGVEYRLVLTSKGEEKYPGKKRPSHGDDDGAHYSKTAGEKIAAALFWIVFISVALWIAYGWYSTWAAGRGTTGGWGNRPGWGGGGGGGGGGGWGGGPDDNDPPPPYDYQAPKPRPSYGATDGWRPGFWSGALGGAAAGYAAGRSGNRTSNSGSGWGYNNGEGSSRSSSGSSGSYSSTRHESTGFGSTSRR